MGELRPVRRGEPSSRGRGVGILPRSADDSVGKVQRADSEIADEADRGQTLEVRENRPELKERRTAVPKRPSWQDRVLRACDVLIAALALVVLSPVLLAIALAIKLDSRGPAFYRQLRIGVDRRGGRADDDGGRRTRDLGGRPFLMLKFRTMRVDAEADSGPVWSSEGDDRVTRVGRFLRRHRLDELPQFWNVLKGDMSVVGPRPERPSLVTQLRREIDEYQVRQRVRPGITGWAQVNRDSDQTVDDVRAKLRYDLEYLDNRSIGFDFRIMARTIPVMLERELVEVEGEEEPPESSSDDRDGNVEKSFPRAVRT